MTYLKTPYLHNLVHKYSSTAGTFYSQEQTVILNANLPKHIKLTNMARKVNLFVYELLYTFIPLFIVTIHSSHDILFPHLSLITLTHSSHFHRFTFTQYTFGCSLSQTTSETFIELSWSHNKHILPMFWLLQWMFLVHTTLTNVYTRKSSQTWT